MRKKIFNFSGILLFFIFILNTVGNIWNLYGLFNWYDIVMHFLGGLWVSSVWIWIYFAKVVEYRVNKKTILCVLFVLSGVLFIALLWEVFEFGVQGIFRLGHLFATPQDSLSDIGMGILGGLLGVNLFMNLISVEKNG